MSLIKLTYFFFRLLSFISHRFNIEWPLVIRNRGFKNTCSKKALLYYKNDSIIFPWLASTFIHTNLWEVPEIVRILNRYNFLVDIVDRDAKNFIPKNEYDLFIGLGAGHSGKFFAQYAKKLPSATKVLLANGPEPIISNKLVKEQYERFNKRKSCKVPAMRLTEGLDFKTFSLITDYFLVIGEPGSFCPETYKHLKKPVLTYLPSSSPNIKFDPRWIAKRNRKSFLCFVGNGFICKGVDVLVDAFLKMPEANLHICGPDSEKLFFEVLGKDISDSHNISYEGFVDVRGSRFNQLVNECSYVIFASSSEGCATSVTSVLRAGLIPILTPETGIKVGDFGYLLDGKKSDLISKTIEICREAMALDAESYRSKVFDVLEDSLKYTQSSFSTTFEKSLITILNKIGK